MLGAATWEVVVFHRDPADPLQHRGGGMLQDVVLCPLAVHLQVVDSLQTKSLENISQGATFHLDRVLGCLNDEAVGARVRRIQPERQSSMLSCDGLIDTGDHPKS